MSYNVYTAENFGNINHIGIFVETGENGHTTGRKFHVIGSIITAGPGMQYEEKESNDPVSSASYVPGTKQLVGTVDRHDMPRFRAVCQSIPVPGPQLNLNGSRIDRSKPVRRCTEWTAEAVDALRRQGVLQDDEDSDPRLGLGG